MVKEAQNRSNLATTIRRLKSYKRRTIVVYFSHVNTGGGNHELQV
jgi:hypothetical protein